MEQRILHFISLLGQWGYLIIFLGAFLESAALLGLIVPGETMVVIAGILASQGYFDLGDCLIVVTLGALLGDSTGFLLGRNTGREYFDRHRRLFFLKKKHLDKVDSYFQKHGGKTVFFGRFVGFLRALAPFTAGMAKMPYPKFLRYNAPGGILWAIGFTLLGYFFGRSWHLIERWAGRIGVFVFLMILVIAGFGYLYRFGVRNQDRIVAWFKGAGLRIAAHPAVSRFLTRHPAVVQFLKERFSPAQYLGLHLTAGLIISAIFAWGLGLVTRGIIEGTPLVTVDTWVLDRVLYLRTPVVSAAMLAFAGLGSIAAIGIGAFALSVALLLKKHYDSIVTLFVALIGSGLLVYVVKVEVRRMRPMTEAAPIDMGWWSFPSSNATMSMVFFGMLAYFIVRDRGSWQLKVLATVASALIVFLIGLSSIYLQLNYLSDVIAGFVGGLFWLTICMTGLEVYRKSKQ